LAARTARQSPQRGRQLSHADRHSRPQRSGDAVTELLTLQAVNAAALEALPDALQGTATADAEPAIVDLDRNTLAANEPSAATAATSETP
jgi:hypothetical protein